MASPAHRGQVMIELLLVVLLLFTFFLFAHHLGQLATREHDKNRFSSTSYRK